MFILVYYENYNSSSQCDDISIHNDNDDDSFSNILNSIYATIWLLKKLKRFDKDITFGKTRPDTRAKTVCRALLILRSILSSIRPFPSSIHLTVDEYDNE